MRTIYRLNGQKIDINLPKTINDTYYPNIKYNWMDLGIEEVQVEDYPDPTWNTWTENADGTLNITPKTVDECKAIQKSRIAAARYEKEIKGVTLPNGVTVATDRESQATLSGALLATMRNPSITVDWKAENGFVQLDKVQIEAISDAVVAHVQQAFSWEKQQCDVVDALTTFEEVVAYTIPVESVNE